MTGEVVELDVSNFMTADEALARASREGYARVIVVGYMPNGSSSCIFSTTSDGEAYFSLCLAAQAILNGSFDA